jgi:hypothetical protein
MAIPEEDYRRHAHLTETLATRYEVEAALFHPTVGVQLSCPITLRYTAKDAATDVVALVTNTGLVAPWCFRRALRHAWQRLTRWWLALSPEHFVVASDGTGLGVLRNTGEPIPWDLDIDVQLYAEGPPALPFHAFADWSANLSLITKGSAALSPPAALQELHELGFMWVTVHDYSARGAGWHVAFEFTDATTRPSAVRVDVDAVFKAYYTRKSVPLTLNLAGVTVHFGQELQRSLAEKYGPAEKRLKSGQLLGCHSPGHNACLPDCILEEGWHERLCESEACAAAQAGDPRLATACDLCRDGPVVSCEFPDRFVELDVFE